MRAPCEQLPLFPSATGTDRESRAAETSTALTPRRHPERRRRGWRERVFEVAAETLWPTRCAVCDAPGAPLCASCARKLPYIDALLACPRCGAPFGRVQCTECNAVMLAPFGYQVPPYDGAVSPLLLTEEARRIVTVYKDQNERALARPMAAIMARYLPDRWLPEAAMAFVPATPAARRRRGFDHAEHIARELSWIAETPFAPLLAPPRRLDQRMLSRTQRIGNMRTALTVLPGATMPRRVILVDDVYTTGATLFAAAEALRKGGAQHIYCITFARA